MLAAILAASAPFIINMLMGVAKWTEGIQTTAGKRFFLAILSIIGALAFGKLTGNPIDWDSVGSLVTVALEALTAFLMAHGSYTLFWDKPARPKVMQMDYVQ